MPFFPFLGFEGSIVASWIGVKGTPRSLVLEAVRHLFLDLDLQLLDCGLLGSPEDDGEHGHAVEDRHRGAADVDYAADVLHQRGQHGMHEAGLGVAYDGHHHVAVFGVADFPLGAVLG